MITSAFAEIVHFGTIACAVALNALGVGIGQGITNSASLDAMNQQPAARNEIVKVAILGTALIETAAVIGLFIAGLLLFGNNSERSVYGAYAEIGIMFAICLPGLVLGIASALPARAGCFAVARQPFFSQHIIRFMLLAMSLIQTPIIFGLIVALFIRGQADGITTMREALRLLSSGVCMGLGSIGPAYGLALFGQAACRGIGQNRAAYNSLLSFMFVSQAIIETPIIFSLVIAIALLFLVPSLAQENILNGLVLLAAALCAGIGTIGVGIGSGKSATAACKQIALHPDQHGPLSRTSMFAQGLIETMAIYAVLITFILLFFVE